MTFPNATLTIDTASGAGSWARALRHNFAAPTAGRETAELGRTPLGTEANGRGFSLRVAVGEARSRGCNNG